MRKIPFFIIPIMVLALAACSYQIPLSTAVVTPTATPTNTPIPSATPIPPPTATPEVPPTPEPTATPEMIAFAAPVTGIWPATSDGSLSLWPADGPFDGEPTTVAPPDVFQPAGGQACGMKKNNGEVFLLSCDNGQPGGHAFRFADVSVPEPASSLIQAQGE
jgi:hypothetical protein